MSEEHLDFILDSQSDCLDRVESESSCHWLCLWSYYSSTRGPEGASTRLLLHRQADGRAGWATDDVSKNVEGNAEHPREEGKWGSLALARKKEKPPALKGEEGGHRGVGE